MFIFKVIPEQIGNSIYKGVALQNLVQNMTNRRFSRPSGSCAVIYVASVDRKKGSSQHH